MLACACGSRLHARTYVFHRHIQRLNTYLAGARDDRRKLEDEIATLRLKVEMLSTNASSKSIDFGWAEEGSSNDFDVNIRREGPAHNVAPARTQPLEIRASHNHLACDSSIHSLEPLSGQNGASSAAPTPKGSKPVTCGSTSVGLQGEAEDLCGGYYMVLVCYIIFSKPHI